MKENYTRVCRSNMNLANVRFLYGCSGRNLDIVAREPLWEAGLDYKHGTGHGVGYTLSVHEGPNAFRWKKSPVSEECVLEEGMITTDEPGIYIEDSMESVWKMNWYVVRMRKILMDSLCILKI